MPTSRDQEVLNQRWNQYYSEFMRAYGPNQHNAWAIDPVRAQQQAREYANSKIGPLVREHESKARAESNARSKPNNQYSTITIPSGSGFGSAGERGIGGGSGAGGFNFDPMQLLGMYMQYQLGQEYQNAAESAKQENLLRYNELREGTTDTRERVLDTIADLGKQQRSDVNRQFDDARSSALADLTARGLSGSTIRAGIENTNRRERNEALRRVEDDIAMRTAQLDASLSDKIHGVIERRNDTGPDFNQLIGLSQGLGQGGNMFNPFMAPMGGGTGGGTSRIGKRLVGGGPSAISTHGPGSYGVDTGYNSSGGGGAAAPDPFMRFIKMMMNQNRPLSPYSRSATTKVQVPMQQPIQQPYSQPTITRPMTPTPVGGINVMPFNAMFQSPAQYFGQFAQTAGILGDFANYNPGFGYTPRSRQLPGQSQMQPGPNMGGFGSALGVPSYNPFQYLA